MDTRTSQENRKSGIACAGKCTSPGMCPGRALLVSAIAGYGISALTGLEWTFYVIAIAGTILLMLGAHHWLLRLFR